MKDHNSRGTKRTLPRYTFSDPSTGDGAGEGVHVARMTMNNTVRSRDRGAAFMAAALELAC